MTSFHPCVSNNTCGICLHQGSDIAHDGPNGDLHPWHLSCIIPWLIKNDTCPQCKVILDRRPFWKERLVGEIDGDSFEFLVGFLVSFVPKGSWFQIPDTTFDMTALAMGIGLMGTRALMLKGAGRAAAIAVVVLSAAFIGGALGVAYSASPVELAGHVGLGMLAAAMTGLDGTSAPPAVILGALTSLLIRSF